jgi:hypothetical protein
MKRKSGFREDRDWNLDLQHVDDVITAADKVRYQQILRRKWEATELPSDLPFAPMDGEWWQTPYDPDPRIHIERQLKRMRDGR